MKVETKKQLLAVLSGALVGAIGGLLFHPRDTSGGEAMSYEAELLEWRKRTLELRVAFQARERDRLRAEIEAEEIRQGQLKEELARTQEKVRLWLEQAPPEKLGKPN